MHARVHIYIDIQMNLGSAGMYVGFLGPGLISSRRELKVSIPNGSFQAAAHKASAPAQRASGR